jgi:hypothetical protein
MISDPHDVQNYPVRRYYVHGTSTSQLSSRRGIIVAPITVPGQGITQHLYNPGFTIYPGPGADDGDNAVRSPPEQL